MNIKSKQEVKKERDYWRNIRKSMKASGRSYEGYKHTYRGGVRDGISRLLDKIFGK